MTDLKSHETYTDEQLQLQLQKDWGDVMEYLNEKSGFVFELVNYAIKDNKIEQTLETLEGHFTGITEVVKGMESLESLRIQLRNYIAVQKHIKKIKEVRGGIAEYVVLIVAGIFYIGIAVVYVDCFIREPPGNDFLTKMYNCKTLISEDMPNFLKESILEESRELGSKINVYIASLKRLWENRARVNPDAVQSGGTHALPGAHGGAAIAIGICVTLASSVFGSFRNSAL